MMLIFEEIQINTSDGVYQKTSPSPPPLLQLALFGMISMCLQGNKKTERSSDTLITRKGAMLIASCVIWS